MDKAALEEIFQAVEDAVARRGQEIIRSHVKLTRDLDAAVQQIETLRMSCKRLNSRNHMLESDLIRTKDKLAEAQPYKDDFEARVDEAERGYEKMVARNDVNLKGWDATRDRLIADLTEPVQHKGGSDEG